MSPAATDDGDRWFELEDRAVYLPSASVLVIADLHLGRSRTSNVELPLPESEPILERIERLLMRFGPDTVVFAGDVCHAFDRVPDGVEETIGALEDLLAANGARPVFVGGNHDRLLEELVEPVAEEHRTAETVICHGHEEPSGAAERYVFGHDHPAIEIEGRRYPCYLWGPSRDGDGEILVLPAFSELVSGTLVNWRTRTDVQSPLVGGLASCRPVVRDEDRAETLVFPPLEELRDFLE